MTGLEIMTAALSEVGDLDGRRFTEADVFAWIDTASRKLVGETEILQGGTYRTRVDGDVTTDTDVVVDAIRDFRVGDRIDIIDTSGDREASDKRVTSIAVDTKTLTLASAVTVSDTSFVYMRNDSGLVDLVEDQEEYYVPWSAMRIKQILIKHSDSADYRVLRQMTEQQSALGRAQNAGWPTASQRSTWVQGYIQLSHELLQLFPAPGADITDGMKITFVRRPFPLVNMEDEPELSEDYHQAIVHYVCALMYARDGDQEKAALNMQLFSDEVQRGRRKMGFPSEQPSISPQTR